MGRIQLLIIWLVLLVIVPIYILVLLVDVILGTDTRGKNMCIGFDEVGNAMLGGDPSMTISTRVGNGVIQGKSWAIYAAFFIDSLFGEGHCLNNATIKQ